MEKLEEDYLLKRVESNIDTRILSFSHNSYWPYYAYLLSEKKGNLKIDTYGGSTSYLLTRRNYVLDSYDFIIFYSSSMFDFKELDALKKIALEISNNFDKRVTIGYSYIIPKEQRQNQNDSDEVNIISFKNNCKMETTALLSSYDTILDLVNLVVVGHEEFENKKIYKKS